MASESGIVRKYAFAAPPGTYGGSPSARTRQGGGGGGGGGAPLEGGRGRPRRGHTAGRLARGLGRGGIEFVADVLIGEDAVDGLLHAPHGVDRRRVGGGLGGRVGQEDLGLEGQAMKGVREAAVEARRPAKFGLQFDQGEEQLVDDLRRDRFAPTQARNQTPGAGFLGHSGVSEDNFA